MKGSAIGSIFLMFGYCFLFSVPERKWTEELHRILHAQDPYVNVGVCVISPDQKKSIYEHHADRLYTPASNAKLFPAAAILHKLGPDFCFKTVLMTHGAPSHDVVLRASGDPSLTDKDLTDLLAKLKKEDSAVVAGDFVVDISLFDDGISAYYAPGVCVDDVGDKEDGIPVCALMINGNIESSPEGKIVAVTNVHDFLLARVKKALASAGVTVAGNIRIESAPMSYEASQELACHTSLPLKELNAHMLKDSDNLYANAFFKLLGSLDAGERGNWTNGQDAIKHFLTASVGISPVSCALRDGAGLSQYNLISPRLITQLLAWAYAQPKLYPLFAESMAIAGVDGTLKNRLSKYTGRVKAKTGMLGRVSTLSGYVYPNKEQAPIIFSIMLNSFLRRVDVETGQAVINYKRDIEDSLCGCIADQLAA